MVKSGKSFVCVRVYFTCLLSAILLIEITNKCSQWIILSPFAVVVSINVRHKNTPSFLFYFSNQICVTHFAQTRDRVKNDAPAISRCIDRSETLLAVVCRPEVILVLDNADGVCDGKV
jgi:hypothetical protein